MPDWVTEQATRSCAAAPSASRTLRLCDYAVVKHVPVIVGERRNPMFPPSAVSGGLMDDRAQTLAHLRLVASSAGYWELRALHRAGPGSTMEPRGSFFLIATATPEALVYDRLETAIDWAEEHARANELFLGMNPRSHAGKGKDAVTRLTACYADLDLADGVAPEDALETVTAGDRPLPSFVVTSGSGLHLVYPLQEPLTTKRPGVRFSGVWCDCGVISVRIAPWRPMRAGSCGSCHLPIGNAGRMVSRLPWCFNRRIDTA